LVLVLQRFYVIIHESQCLFLSHPFNSFIVENGMYFNDSHRGHLNYIYRSALSAVNGRHCVAQYLRDHPVAGEIYLLAIGKAAAAMARGAHDVLASQIKHTLIITNADTPDAQLPNSQFIEAGHPVPDKRSLKAGQQLLEFVNQLPSKAKLLCLISGGTSSLVEVLPEKVSLSDLQKLNLWLLRNEFTIAEMNAVRKRLSCIKGGRLATKLGDRETTVLLISDVKGNNPAEIGSGLLFPPTARDLSLDIKSFPAELSRLIERSPPLPESHDRCFDKIRYAIVASLDMALIAARQCAISQGYDVILHSDYLQGDAVQAGKTIATAIRKSPGKLQLWGGECTVKLPENHGTGGRCQSLALSAALNMEGERSWCLLAAGTDGSDGTENVAGACVDNETIRRARHLFPESEALADYLNRADAGTCLRQTNDLVVTGSTGTNVTDVVFAYCE